MSAFIPSAPDLRDAAEALGWQLAEGYVARRLYVLENAMFPSRQIVLPMDDDRVDSKEAIILALHKLSTLHKLQPQILAQRAIAARDDILRFGLPIDQPSVPLGFAADVLSAAKQSILVSATTVLAPRPHHPRLSMAVAQQVVDACKFGHTEHGSFVMKLLCPITAVETPPRLPLQNWANLPMVRQTTLTLHQGLVKLVDAIERDRLEEIIDSLGSTPFSRTHLRRSILAERSVHVEAKEVQRGVQAGSG